MFSVHSISIAYSYVMYVILYCIAPPTTTINIEGKMMRIVCRILLFALKNWIYLSCGSVDEWNPVINMEKMEKYLKFWLCCSSDIQYLIFYSCLSFHLHSISYPHIINSIFSLQRKSWTRKKQILCVKSKKHSKLWSVIWLCKQNNFAKYFSCRL